MKKARNNNQKDIIELKIGEISMEVN